MAQKKIWCRRKSYSVIREMRVGEKTYAVVRKLSGVRERYQVFDPKAGPDGDMRAIHVFKRSNHVLKRVRLLARAAESNSNVPTILEYHPWKGRVYVVLTWVWGDDLEEYLVKVRKNKVPFPSPGESLRLIRGLAHGVSNLNHRKNIVHGDIKPANLILGREPSRLVLVDFGSSWFVEKTTSWKASDGISPAYAAPEQRLVGPEESGAIGSPDFRSDQFSVSVVLYELLTLKLPYGGLGGAAGSERSQWDTMSGEFVPPSQLTRHPDGLPVAIWKQLDALVAKGLALDPNDRFPNRSSWLGEFDDMHGELKRRERMGVWQSGLLNFLELPIRVYRKLFTNR